MDPIRKRDWGGRWGWALKTEVLNWRQRKLFSYTGTPNVNFFITGEFVRTFWLLAILCALVYNIVFNTGVLQWAK
jgi:hypothetical protein